MPKFLTLDESISLLKRYKMTRNQNKAARLCDCDIVSQLRNAALELVGINKRSGPRAALAAGVGKGGKERIVYLNTACKEALLEYLKWRLGVDHARLATKALFLSNRNQRISVKTVQWMVYKYLAAAGLGSRRYSVHKLRHTAATLMYQSGDRPARAQGHCSMSSSSRRYTHMSATPPYRAMEKNPRQISALRVRKSKRLIFTPVSSFSCL